MSFDPITLAIAKKQLSNTTAVINANDYGIDPGAIGTSGQTQTVIHDSGLFAEINKHKNFVIECYFLEQKITLTPTSIIRSPEGVVYTFTITVSVSMPMGLTRMELTLMGEGRTVIVNCVTTVTQV